jgi:hypothetical protein
MQIEFDIKDLAGWFQISIQGINFHYFFFVKIKQNLEMKRKYKAGVSVLKISLSLDE